MWKDQLFFLCQYELSDPYLYRKTSTYKRIEREGAYYPELVYTNTSDKSPSYQLTLKMLKDEKDYKRSIVTRYGFLAIFTIVGSAGLMYFSEKKLDFPKE